MSSGTSWGMSSEGPQEPKPTRRDLYEMADAVAVDLAVEQPDWCAVAHDAEELTRHLQERCRVSREQ